jgi:hypothetical protein
VFFYPSWRGDCNGIGRLREADAQPLWHVRRWRDHDDLRHHPDAQQHHRRRQSRQHAHPIIKFTTLFGLLAVEITVAMTNATAKYAIGGVLFAIAQLFIYRSFFGMRIPEEK